MSGNFSKISLMESVISNFLMSFRACSLRSLHSAAEMVNSNQSRLNLAFGRDCSLKSVVPFHS